MIDKESLEIVSFVVIMAFLFIVYQWWEDRNPFE